MAHLSASLHMLPQTGKFHLTSDVSAISSASPSSLDALTPGFAVHITEPASVGLHLQ